MATAHRCISVTWLLITLSSMSIHKSHGWPIHVGLNNSGTTGVEVLCGNEDKENGEIQKLVFGHDQRKTWKFEEKDHPIVLRCNLNKLLRDSDQVEKIAYCVIFDSQNIFEGSYLPKKITPNGNVGDYELDIRDDGIYRYSYEKKKNGWKLLEEWCTVQ